MSKKTVDRENSYQHVVGIDWGSQTHQVCLISPRCAPEQRQFAHRAEGLAALVAWLSKRCGAAGSVAIGIEVPHGAVVETLLEHGFAVFSLNPKQLDRFRDRHSVAGAKDDRLDAFVLADALRSDRHKFKRLSIPDATTLALREVSRRYDTLKVDLLRLANRLREQLHATSRSCSSSVLPRTSRGSGNCSSSPRITVNLAPADVRKHRTRRELP